MNIYEVSYWREGPGRSGTVVTFVAARTKKLAIKHVVDTHGVYTADRPYVTAKLIKKVDAVTLSDWG